MAHEHREGRIGTVRTGETVVFHDGSKAGTVSRVIVDPNNDIMTDLVVKKGMLMSEERIVPIGCIDFAETGTLHLDMDKDGFHELGRFDGGNYRATDPDYTGPPGFDASANGAANLQFEATVAAGSQGALGGVGRPLGFPGSEAYRNTDPMTRPDLGPGDDVLDMDGEKVGVIDLLEVDAATGEPTRLVVREGMIFRTKHEVPASSIGELSNRGIILDIRKDQLETEQGVAEVR